MNFAFQLNTRLVGLSCSLEALDQTVTSLSTNQDLHLFQELGLVAHTIDAMFLQTKCIKEYLRTSPNTLILYSGEDVSTGHNYCQRSLLRRERRPRSKAGLPSCNKVNNDILILITRYCRWRKNIYKNAKTKQLFARRWQWVWAPWWTPRRFSFLSPAQTRPLPSTRCPFKHWCHDDINDGFTLCSGDWGGSLPHVDCVSFPAASKHDDHCRRGWKILTAWEHHILIVLVEFQHECTRTQPLSCECGQWNTSRTCGRLNIFPKNLRSKSFKGQKQSFFLSKQVHADLNELSDDEMRKLSLGPKAHQAQLL